MHDALGNAFMVKVGELLAQHKVFKQHRAAHAKFERILVVGNRHALIGREQATRLIDVHPVQCSDSGIHAFGRNAAGFFRAVFF